MALVCCRDDQLVFCEHFIRLRFLQCHLQIGCWQLFCFHRWHAFRDRPLSFRKRYWRVLVTHSNCGPEPLACGSFEQVYTNSFIVLANNDIDQFCIDSSIGFHYGYAEFGVSIVAAYTTIDFIFLLVVHKPSCHSHCQKLSVSLRRNNKDITDAEYSQTSIARTLISQGLTRTRLWVPTKFFR